MATPTETSASSVPTLVGGAWQTSSATQTGEVFNPSTGKVIAQVPLCDKQETDDIVAAAAAVLPEWNVTPAVERARVMFKFRDLIEKHFDLHRRRLRRPAVQAPLQRGNDRHQCRRAGPDGLVPFYRLEPIILRRPTHPGDRKRAFLYPAKNDAHALVPLR